MYKQVLNIQNGTNVELATMTAERGVRMLLDDEVHEERERDRRREEWRVRKGERGRERERETAIQREREKVGERERGGRERKSVCVRERARGRECV